MAYKQQAFPVREVLAGIDTNSKTVWKELNAEEKKCVNFWLAVVMTNQLYNKNWNELGAKHPHLQWHLLCATHNAKSEIRKHVWIGFKKKQGNNNAIKLLQKIHPNMKQDEVELLARLSTKKELKELAKDHEIEIKL